VPLPTLRDDQGVVDGSLGDRRHSGTRRIVISVLSGLVGALVAAWFVPWQLTVLIGWDVVAVVAVVWSWSEVWHFDAADTRAYARDEDTSPGAADLVMLAASTVSLIGVAIAFVKANEASDDEELLIKLVGILTILLSWIVVHTVQTFKYADVYYDDPVGGVEFRAQGNEQAPDYRDFAYLAFTVGMTYQVSDTEVTQHKMRRMILWHALLSFVFGAVILATTVNLIASLLNS
jgi:uncharacterized membrane protein